MVTRSLLTPRRALVALLGVPLLVIALIGVETEPPPAAAQVVQRQGFRATVLGWSSWYGSYGMGQLGAAWCIDHGSRAPDAAFGYAPTSVAELTDDTRVAMAWAVARHATDDRVGAAALMLVMHDLRGAQYPFGRLDVHRMTLRDLAGFDGHEAHVLHRAREIKNDALAHRHLRGPLRLTATAPTLRPGAEGELVVELLDAAGHGVDGIEAVITVEGASPIGSTTIRTDGSGRGTLRFRAAEGTNRFAVSATAPDLSLQAWGSTSVTAQRVVRPASVTLTAQAELTARVPTGMVVVDKDGDAEAYLGVAGAIFEIHHPERGPVKALVTGPDGRSPAAELEVGSYRLVETRPPVGYEAVAPVDFTLTEGQQLVIPVRDPATRTDLEIEKVDAVSGEPVAGARIDVHYDADNNGEFETAITSVTTTSELARIGDLLPGNYRITEVLAPMHYRAALDPVDVQLSSGSPHRVTIENSPTATVSFVKVPESDPPAGTSLAGAVFTVHPRANKPPAPPESTPPTTAMTTTTTALQNRGPRSTEGGVTVEPDDGLIPPAWACTTDEQGTCSLPDDALLAGHEYCWTETQAPAGFGLAEGGCFTPETAGHVVEIRVVEPVLAPGPSGDAEVESSSFTREAIPPPTRAGGLPVTGTGSGPLAMVGLGLVLFGAALSAGARHRARND